MNPEAYVLNIKTRLLNESNVVEYRITHERATDADIYVRARIKLANDGYLLISEYGEGDESGDIHVIMYSYHWMDAHDKLIARWDNAKHYPDLPGFPHHWHNGDEKNVLPGEPMNLFKVLDFIATRLNQ